jgi:ABC-type sugar transport system permease subunit
MAFPGKNKRENDKPQKGRRLTLHGRDSLVGGAFVLPWVIGFLLLTLYPLIRTVHMSFNTVKISSHGISLNSVGMENYREIFTMDVTFLNSLWGYIKEIIVYVPLILVFSLIIAMLLNQGLKGTGILRTIFFLPVIITSGPVIQHLTNNGALHMPGNSALIASFFASGALPLWAINILAFLIDSFTTILWNCGLQILVFLAGLQKIDPNVIEAARIDGASTWEIFWKITIKIINPLIVLNMLFTVIVLSSFSINPIITKIKADLFDAERGFGYGAALSLVYFVIEVAVIGLGLLLVMQRKKERE